NCIMAGFNQQPDRVGQAAYIQIIALFKQCNQVSGEKLSKICIEIGFARYLFSEWLACCCS
ncbi:MAG: hypothetical protein AAFR22_26255, partial [Chloroflexota bacterium]